MTRQRFDISNDKGFALIYMCVFLVVLLLFVGLAVDTGRAYVVKAQLTKAVDGAALGAARMLNSGNPRTEAENIFNANFPVGFMGTTSVTPTSSASFYRLTTDVTTGINTVTITASAVMPTSFMSLANFNNVTVSSEGQATRRMVDLSLVIDVSSSIGWRWPYVREAVISFINAFDQTSDRISLTFYGNGGRVIDRMRDTRGFDKAAIISHVPAGLPGGSTAMVAGLYRGWDELRAVPNGLQSGSASHRVVHRRLLQQRAGHARHIGNVEGVEDLGLSEEPAGSRRPDARPAAPRRVVPTRKPGIRTRRTR